MILESELTLILRTMRSNDCDLDVTRSITAGGYKCHKMMAYIGRNSHQVLPVSPM
uniref:Uncharacterized protein n=1 Tax=Arion vulgaris TaxID=1028688 RepID=A0A0B6ZS77_9EUPU